MKNLPITYDPMDPASPDQRATVEVIDPASVPASYRDAQRTFNILYKADWGLNWNYLDQLSVAAGTGALVNNVVSMTSLPKPVAMILAVSSIWNRDASGAPYGGGNDAVDSPCIRDVAGNYLEPGAPYLGGYYWYGGWNPSSPLSWNVFGGTWPWVQRQATGLGVLLRRSREVVRDLRADRGLQCT